MTKKKKGLSERIIQRSNIHLLTMMGFQVAAVPNGLNLSGDKIARAKQMAVAKADGLRVGFPDLIILGKLPGLVGFIECKEEFETELDPPHQPWWAEEMARRGMPWALVNTVDGSVGALRDWGWIK